MATTTVQTFEIKQSRNLLQVNYHSPGLQYWGKEPICPLAFGNDNFAGCPEARDAQTFRTLCSRPEAFISEMYRGVLMAEEAIIPKRVMELQHGVIAAMDSPFPATSGTINSFGNYFALATTTRGEQQ